MHRKAFALVELSEKNRCLSLGFLFVMVLGAALSAHPVGQAAENTQGKKAPIRAYAKKKYVKNQVEFALKVTRDNVAGEPVNLEIQIINRSKKRISHTYVNSLAELSVLRVTTKSGQSVPLTRYGNKNLRVDNFLRTLTLYVAPGTAHSVTLNLSLLFDLTLPGTYHVAVAKLINSGPDAFMLSVDKLEFKVVEPVIVDSVKHLVDPRIISIVKHIKAEADKEKQSEKKALKTAPK